MRAPPCHGWKLSAPICRSYRLYYCYIILYPENLQNFLTNGSWKTTVLSWNGQPLGEMFNFRGVLLWTMVTFMRRLFVMCVKVKPGMKLDFRLGNSSFATRLPKAGFMFGLRNSIPKMIRNATGSTGWEGPIICIEYWHLLLYIYIIYTVYTFTQLVKVDNPNAQNEPTEDSQENMIRA